MNVGDNNKSKCIYTSHNVVETSDILPLHLQVQFVQRIVILLLHQGDMDKILDLLGSAFELHAPYVQFIDVFLDGIQRTENLFKSSINPTQTHQNVIEPGWDIVMVNSPLVNSYSGSFTANYLLNNALFTVVFAWHASYAMEIEDPTLGHIMIGLKIFVTNYAKDSSFTGNTKESDYENDVIILSETSLESTRVTFEDILHIIVKNVFQVTYNCVHIVIKYDDHSMTHDCKTESKKRIARVFQRHRDYMLMLS